MPLYGPDTNNPSPMAGHPRVGFLKPLIRSPLIEVGDYTYYDDPDGPENFERNVLYHFGPDKLVIGKFCAIATGVTFIMGGANHKIDCVSTYPFPIMGGGWETHMDLLMGLPSRGDTIIGNDVWIGYQATIMAGVHIGDGAIIASKAVVTQDVPPYAIVGGNPGRVLRHRFPPETVDALLELRWWDWSPEKITSRIRALMSLDLDALRA